MGIHCAVHQAKFVYILPTSWTGMGFDWRFICDSQFDLRLVVCSTTTENMHVFIQVRTQSAKGHRADVGRR